MNNKVDPKRRDSQSDLGPEESDQDSWFPDRRTLDEKIQEAIEEAVAEIRRAVREALESES
jgi:hypothetical protein